MINYQVMTEEEATAERFKLLQSGDYDATIDNAIDKVSQKSGCPMIEINFSVYDKNGKSYSIKDWLTFQPNMMWKIIKFCKSANLMDEYNSQKLCADTVRGKNIRVRVSIDKGIEIPIEKLNGQPEGSCYPDRNKIIDYIIIKPNSVKPIEDIPFNDDELPF